MHTQTHSTADARQQQAASNPGAWKSDLIEACAGLAVCALLSFVLFAASAIGTPLVQGVR